MAMKTSLVSANLQQLQEVEKNDSFILTPGRFVGMIEEEEDDGIPFDDKMKKRHNF